MKCQLSWDFGIENQHAQERLSTLVSHALLSLYSLCNNRTLFVGNEDKFLFESILRLIYDGRLLSKSPLTINDLYFQATQDLQVMPWVHKSLPCRYINKLRVSLKSLSNRVEISRAGSCIHYAAHLSRASFVTENLSIKHRRLFRVDLPLRRQFFDYLTAVGLSNDTSKIVSTAFPVSHLEAKSYWDSISYLYPISRLASSIYGIMADPAMSAVVRNQKPELIYVQHGGGYGLLPNNAWETYESTGCDRMLNWGTGTENVYPTRFSHNPEIFSAPYAIVLLSMTASCDEKSFWLGLKSKLLTATHGQIVLHIAAHPHSRGRAKPFMKGASSALINNASVVIFDNVLHTAMFERLLTGKPFYCIETVDAVPQSLYARRFLDLMRRNSILIQAKDLFDALLIHYKQSTPGPQSWEVYKWINDFPRLPHLMDFDQY